MKNINQDSQGNSKALSTYQIVNNIPEKQEIILHNTQKDYPIQLRVDPVTDYYALFFTLITSILVSAIAAFVTIWLVTKSNNKLSEDQVIQQKEMFEKQEQLRKKESEAKYRQAWIDRVRNLFIDYFADINHLTIEFQKYINSEICNAKGDHVEVFKTFDFRFKSYYNTADLLLSKDNPLDRDIVNKMYEIQYYYVEIFSDLMAHTQKSNPQQIPASYFDQSGDFKSIQSIKKEINSKIKELLKNEWERVKSFN